jgi:hypothetical protein
VEGVSTVYSTGTQYIEEGENKEGKSRRNRAPDLVWRCFITQFTGHSYRGVEDEVILKSSRRIVIAEMWEDCGEQE